ncbi:MAG TPA: EamA family transporter, partial [Lachnospiraceae bacterium]|nr:EamA family transporter [Lachnospiraceae bacterium]
MILLLATIIWGTSLVTQSIGMSYIGPFTFNAVRFFVGAATLIPIIALKGRKGKAILSINVKKTTLSAGIINGTVLFLTAS